MGTFRRLAAAIVVAIAFVAPSADRAAAQSWIVYSPSGGGYSVELPSEPKILQQDVPTAAGTAKLTQAVVDAGDVAFLATYIDYDASIIGSRTTDGHLDAARDGQAQGGSVVSEQRIQVSGYPARHVVITKSGLFFVVRTVLVGRRLFQFIYVAKPGHENDPAMTRFVNSIRIVQG